MFPALQCLSVSKQVQSEGELNKITEASDIQSYDKRLVCRDRCGIRMLMGNLAVNCDLFVW